MTRKDYIAIAKTISSLDEIVDDYALEAIAEAFADSLAVENPRFDRKRFIVASTATDSKREAILAQLS